MSTHSPDLYSAVGDTLRPIRCSLCERSIPVGTDALVVSRQPIDEARRAQTYHLACAAHLSETLAGTLEEAGYSAWEHGRITVDRSA